MPLLIAHEHMQVPPSEAESHVERYFEMLGHAGTLRLHLRVPSGAFGIGGGVALEKDVVATFEHRVDDTYRNRLLAISWAREAPGIFPRSTVLSKRLPTNTR